MDWRVLMRWILLGFVTVALQVGLVSTLRVFGVAPDLCVVLAACAGLALGPVRGACIGFAAGLGLDIVLSGQLGVTALAYTLVGYAVGLVHDGTMRRGAVMDLLAVAVGAAAGQLLYAMLAHLLGTPALTDPKLWRVPIIVGLAAAILARPTLALCRWAEGGVAAVR